MKVVTLFQSIVFCLISIYGLAQNTPTPMSVPFPNKFAEVSARTDTAKLMSLSRKWHQRFEKQRQAAINWAKSNGYRSEGKTIGGKSFAIIGLDTFGHPIYVGSNNLIAARTISTDDVWAGGSAGLSLDGAEWNIGVWDVGAVRATHQELNGRIYQIDTPNMLNDHATHVSGTLAATGINSNAKGMAPMANIIAHDFLDDLSEMAYANAQNWVFMSNHSYGSFAGWDYDDHGNGLGWYWFGNATVNATEDYKFGFYDSDAHDFDELVYESPFYLVVKAAGNDRGEAHSGSHFMLNSAGNWVTSSASRQSDGGPDGFDCIPTLGNAKNILTVGAIEDLPNGYSSPSNVTISSFSGWGPTDDGRIKPDIVGNGVGVFSSIATGNSQYSSFNGTSMSSPNVAGSMTLLLEHAYETYGGWVTAATLKALVLHTADDAGNAGPDYKFGWGVMNTRKATDLVTESTDPYGAAYLSEELLESGSELNYQVYSDGTQPLRATIVWSDPAASASAPTLNPTSQKLVNDLDLRLTHSPSGTTHSPWRLNPANPSAVATFGDNARDNVEQVYIANPTPGLYNIEISHKGNLTNGEQWFSMVLTGKSTSGGNTNGCDQATTITCGATVTGTTSGASQNVPACGGTDLNTAPGRWYRFIGTGEDVTVSTCHLETDFDTKIGIFSGTCSNLVCVSGNDDDLDCGTKTTVNFTAANGQTYYIYVTGFNSFSGTYELSVECGSGCVAAPYPPEDPVYQQVIAEDSYCCETEWDEACQDIYDSMSGGTGLNMTTTINVSPLPVVQNQPAAAIFNVTNNSAAAFSGDISIDLYDQSGNYILEIENKTGLSLCAGCTFSTNLTYNFNLSNPPGNYAIAAWYRPNGGNWSEVGDGNFNNTVSFEIVSQPQPVLTVSPSGLNLGAAAGSASFAVTSNCSWSISGAPNWLSLNPSSGNGNATVNFSFQENTSTQSRSATLTITGCGISQTVSITQAGSSSLLTVSPASLSLGSAAGSASFTVTSNCPWSVSGAPSWVSINASSGNGNATVNFSFQENTSTQARSATLTITGCGISQSVSITQAGASSVLTVSPASLSLGSAAGSASFTVTSNCPWSVSGAPSWLSLNPSSGNGNATVNFSSQENTSTQPRSATLTISGCGISQSVTITQSGASSVLTVSPLTLNVPAIAGNQAISVSGNSNWTAVPNNPWLGVQNQTANGFNLHWTENTSTSSQIGTVTVSDGSTMHTIVVTQTAAIEFLNASPLLIEVGANSGNASVLLQSNTNWVVSESSNWLSVNLASGTGNASLGVVYDANPTPDERQATITIFGAGQQLQVLVTQDGSTATFAISPSAIEVNAPADCINIALNSPGLWTANSVTPWILSIEPPFGTGSEIVTICFEANAGAAQRQGTVVFSAPGLPDLIFLITQNGTSTATSEPLNLCNWSFFPNPTKDALYFRFELAHSTDLRLDLLTVNGQFVKTALDGKTASGGHLVKVDVADMPGGVYLCRLTSTDGASARRFVVLK